jgi:hypothetical protein
VNTKGCQGNIHKTAYVCTNDPSADRLVLGVRAFVQVPIFVSPRYVFLQGNAARGVTRIVKIEAGLEKPLILEPENFNLEGKIDYEIEEVEAEPAKPVFHITLSDLFRATMADDCGNEGFIGISPNGSQYHVVVPVGRQIARGLKFWIQPDDGTPFGEGI